MRKILGFIIDHDSGYYGKKILDYNDYRDFYKLLNIETFDIVSRQIGGVYYDIICDDEGLLKDKQVPSIITYDNDGNLAEVIVGNVFIVSHDMNGNTTSIDDSDIARVTKSFVKNYKVVIARF